MPSHRSNSQGAPSARTALQAATRAAHLRLHRHPALADLAAGKMQRDAYRSLLGRLYGFHLPLETVLTEAPWPTLFDIRIVERSRIHLLRQDLLDLGSTSETISALPLIDDLPVLDSPGKCLGCLYVREGSTLGAAHLAKALDPLFGSAHLLGRRFLAGRAANSELWRNCCNALEAAADMGLLPDLLAGAEQTFQALESWLEQPPGEWSRVSVSAERAR